MSRKDLFLLDENARLAYEFQPIIQKLVSFTHLSTHTGTQQISSIGFKPTLVILEAVNVGTKEVSNGRDLISSKYTIYTDPNNWSTATNKSIYLQGAAGSSRAYIALTDDDSFTLLWDASGTPTAGTHQIFAHCYK